jgi:hypothetical protein
MIGQKNLIIRRLKPWEELLGQLVELKDESGRLILVLSFSLAIEITDFLDRELLREAIGRKVAILRTDNPLRPFLFRVLEGK